MGFLKEFKDFSVKGNFLDMAVAVVIGGAFGKIVTSFIEDVITPLLLTPALEKAGLKNISELTIFGSVKYGNFLSAIINFIIIAFILFLIVKGANKLKQEEAAVDPGPSSTDVLLTEIRDLLKK